MKAGKWIPYNVSVANIGYPTHVTISHFVPFHFVTLMVSGVGRTFLRILSKVSIRDLREYDPEKGYRRLGPH